MNFERIYLHLINEIEKKKNCNMVFIQINKIISIMNNIRHKNKAETRLWERKNHETISKLLNFIYFFKKIHIVYFRRNSLLDRKPFQNSSISFALCKLSHVSSKRMESSANYNMLQCNC